MKLSSVPNVPGNACTEQFDDAVCQMLIVPKEETKLKEARERKWVGRGDS